MEKVQTFYYLESAPQIVSAYRHLVAHGSRPFRMVVRYNGTKANDDQIDRVLQLLPELRNGTTTCLKAGWRLYALVVRCLVRQRYNDVCVGDVRSSIALAALAMARANRIVLLEDGACTMTFFQRRLKGIPAVTGGVVKRALVRAARVQARDMTLYTQMPIASEGGMTVQASAALPKLFPEREMIETDDNQALFIGSKVVEAGVCTLEYYLQTIGRFVDDFRQYRLVYLAHREEDTSKLRVFPELRVERFELPLELEYGARRSLPKVVATFFSSGMMHFVPFKDRVRLVAYGVPANATNEEFHHSIAACRYLFWDLLGISSKA